MSSFDDLVPLYALWDDVRWDDQEGALYKRGVYYGPHKDKNFPFRWWKRDEADSGELIGDATSQEAIEAVAELERNGFSRAVIPSMLRWGRWEKVSEPETLKVWHELRKRFPDKATRANEFLKYLNLTTYFDLEVSLEKLNGREADDEKKLRELESMKEWKSREDYSVEPYFKREMKREAFREGKIEIEKSLNKHGYDSDAEIMSFLKKRKAEVDHEVLPIVGEQEATKEPQPENIFRQDNDVYEIRYKAGETAHMPYRLGFDHIRKLLCSPRQAVPVDAFLPQSTNNMENWRAEEQGLSLGSKQNTNTGLDDKAKQELEAKLKRILEVEIPALRSNKEQFDLDGTAVATKECEEEIAAKQREAHDIAERLKRDVYPEQDTNAKRKQNAVRNAIKASLQELKKNFKTKDFALHFESSYSGGQTFCYNAKEDIEWLTV